MLCCGSLSGSRFPQILALADRGTMTHFSAVIADVSFMVPVCLCVICASASITFALHECQVGFPVTDFLS